MEKEKIKASYFLRVIIYVVFFLYLGGLTRLALPNQPVLRLLSIVATGSWIATFARPIFPDEEDYL